MDWDHLGVAAWIIGPDSTIQHLNPKAEELLRVRLGDCVGKPCCAVIRATDAARRPVCGPNCAVLAESRTGQPAKPRTILVGGSGGHPPRWVQVMPLPLATHGGVGPSVAMIATDVERWQRIEGYVKKIATREQPLGQAATWQLTSREWEILELLTDDLTQQEIAETLDVCYSTVRTHVQRVLAKCRVHSIQEAVARYLLVHRAGTG